MSINVKAHINQAKEDELLSDEQLMLAYAQNDALAFDQLYQRYKLLVYRFFIRHNLATAIAEELSHDTWLKVINARKNYQVSALFKTYVFTIARRTLYDHQQKKSTQCEQSSDLEVETTVDATSNNDLRAAIKQQLVALPFAQREVFLLKQESGFTIEQIAAITEQNKEQVKSCWRYALKKMRKGLSYYVN